MSRVETMANEAVFQLQFNTREAIRYVMRNANTDELNARNAILKTVKFHRN